MRLAHIPSVPQTLVPPCFIRMFYLHPLEHSTEEQTRAFIDFAISKAEESPCVNYQYAATIKERCLISGIGIDRLLL